MAEIRMVTAVRLNDEGDVVEVEWRVANTVTNTWETAAVRVPVITVVDALMRGDKVYSRMGNGTEGPLVGMRTVLAKSGQAVETIRFLHDSLTPADLPQL